MGWIRVALDAKQEQTEERLNDDGSSLRTCILNFIAQTDVMATSTADALNASAGGTSIPAIGGNYTIGGAAGWRCTRRLPKRGTSVYLFEVQCEFTLKLASGPPAPGQAKWNSDIQFSGIRFTQTAYRDKDNKAIENRAHKAFDPTLEKTYFDEKIDVSFNSFTALSAFAASLRGYVNSDSVTLICKGEVRNFTPRQLLLDEVNISSAAALADGTPVWAIKMSLIGRKDTFVAHVKNCGYGSLVGTDYVKALDKYKQPVEEPVNLALDGTRLPDSADPLYLDFKIEGEASFAGLFVGI